MEHRLPLGYLLFDEPWVKEEILQIYLKEISLILKQSSPPRNSFYKEYDRTFLPEQ